MAERGVDLERRLAAYAEAVRGSAGSGRTGRVELDLGDVEGDPRYELDAATDGALLSFGSTGRCAPAPARPSVERGSWRPFAPAGYGSLELLTLGARGVREWRGKREAIEPAA